MLDLRIPSARLAAIATAAVVVMACERRSQQESNRVAEPADRSGHAGPAPSDERSTGQFEAAAPADAATRAMGAPGVEAQGAPPPPPPQPEEYVVQVGDTWQDVCWSRYRNRQYMHLIAMHQGLAVDAPLRVGQRIRLPELRSVMQHEGLIPRIAGEVELILAARARLVAGETAVLDADRANDDEYQAWRRSEAEAGRAADRRSEPPRRRRLSERDAKGAELERSLLVSSSELSAAADRLAATDVAEVHPPRRAIAALRHAAIELERVRLPPPHYGYGKVLWGADNSVEAALHELVLWARAGFR